MKNSLIVNAPLRDVWEFFSNSNNLAVLTPPEFKLRYMQEPPSSMVTGQQFSYSLSPFPGFRTKWEGEIREVVELERFVDEQREGPFAYWRHEHRFFKQEEGTEICDHLQYALPFGVIGSAFHPFVKRKMAGLFTYRNDKVREIFSQ